MENLKYAVLFLLTCGIAHADQDVKTVGDLDHLQSGRVFYDAQTAFNRSKMAAGQADTVQVPSAPVTSVTTTPGSPAVTPPVPVNTLPVLEKVAGAVATLNFADGSSAMARVGDSIQGGFTVKSVSMRGVVIRRSADGHEFTLN
ncbi:type IV pilus biogenesis protein PilP [Rahnella sikkimica]|uniref:Conjugal transfer protein n=1 Tax=Rahnella sikkimica TaxID=1805933 RepID=A0A2L1UZ11_9GAMM|nr:type IV pilus biogenesis protein PilP [Rahnella sikkimica]AVF38199.1 conjugal transfer protein [Rahnella sikkimica]